MSSPDTCTINLNLRRLSIFFLITHLLAYVALTTALLFALDGSQFYLERPPKVTLAQGTLETLQLGRFNLIPMDVSIIVRSVLTLLRGYPYIWTFGLFFRAIPVIAGRRRLPHHDTAWGSSWRSLPLKLLLILILLFTLGPNFLEAILRDATSWLPENQTVVLPYHPIINITGVLSDDRRPIRDPPLQTTNINKTWSQATEEYVFKRVVPSVANLSVGSTIDGVTVPYFARTTLKWLPGLDHHAFQLLEAMRKNNVIFPSLSAMMGLPGAAALIANVSQDEPQSWSVLINVGKSTPLETRNCNPSTVLLSNNNAVPFFYLGLSSTSAHDSPLSGCFALANVSYDASGGLCKNCRVTSNSTVQNNTALESMATNDHPATRFALLNMPKYLHFVIRLNNSLPNPATNNLEVYITAMLTRLYSALWTSWMDNTGYTGGLTSGYKPAIPMQRAEVDRDLVLSCLSLPLLFTLAGICFLWLQSQYPFLLFEINTNTVASEVEGSRDPEPFQPTELTELLQNKSNRTAGRDSES